MRCKNFCALRVELNLLVDANVNLCEVVAVESLAEHLSAIEDIVLLELLLSTEDIPCRVELLVLLADGLGLLSVVGLQLLFLVSELFLIGAEVLDACIQTCHIAVKPVDGLVELSNMDVLSLKFSTELLKVVVLLDELSLKVLDGLAHLVTLKACLAELLLEFGYELTVFLHALGNELHLLLDDGGLVSTLTVLGDGDTVLGGVNLIEPLLDIVERTHHIVNLIITRLDDRTERVVLYVSGIHLLLS